MKKIYNLPWPVLGIGFFLCCFTEFASAKSLRTIPHPWCDPSLHKPQQTLSSDFALMPLFFGLELISQRLLLTKPTWPVRYHVSLAFGTWISRGRLCSACSPHTDIETASFNPAPASLHNCESLVWGSCATLVVQDGRRGRCPVILLSLRSTELYNCRDYVKGVANSSSFWAQVGKIICNSVTCKTTE